MDTSGVDHQILSAFQSYPVYLTALGIVAVMTVAKRAATTVHGGCLDNDLVKLAMTVGNVALGALVGLVPGFLPGSLMVERVLVGIVAGFMSESFYAVLKRLVPGLVGHHVDDARESPDA